MNSTILGLLAETSIHPGAGQSAGFVDLPVAREAATDYPVIVGSSLKGALRDLARTRNNDDSTADHLFGTPEHAGRVIVSDARLVLLPVRSLSGSFRWITAPHLLTRLSRDFKRAGLSHGDDALASLPVLAAEKALAKTETIKGSNLFLEERQFSVEADVPQTIIDLLRPLFAHKLTADTLADRLIILNDDDFAWFARYGLAINARNQLDTVTKESKNLWYEETLPPDSLFYTLLATRGAHSTTDEAMDQALKLFKEIPYLQVGGNETVGQGWFATSVVNSNALETALATEGAHQ